MKYRPKTIYLEKDILNEPLTKQILEHFPRIKIEQINKTNELKGLKKYPKHKRPLVLAKNRGSFFEKCPGTSEHICCNYFILNLGTGCPYDCSYCFLQFYQKLPVNIIYTNTTDLLEELKTKVGDKSIRIGTGEFMDSLAFETDIPLNQFLIPKIFDVTPNITLELKTKSTNIAIATKLTDFREKIVFSWSLNPESIVLSEEKDSATLNERLQALKQVQNMGYRIAIHFDPIIIVPKWEQKYRELIHEIAKVVNPEQIAWFSLGLFRFAPQLKRIMENNHPDSNIIYGEFFAGPDKKMRYPEPLRNDVFSQIIKSLRNIISKNLPIYFCMESPKIWQNTLGGEADKQSNLSEVFD